MVIGDGRENKQDVEDRFAVPITKPTAVRPAGVDPKAPGVPKKKARCKLQSEIRYFTSAGAWQLLPNASILITDSRKWD